MRPIPPLSAASDYRWKTKLSDTLPRVLRLSYTFFPAFFFRDLNSVYIQNIRAEYDIHTIMQNGAFSRVEAVGLGGSPSILPSSVFIKAGDKSESDRQ